MLSPLQHQRSAAPLALLVGGLLHALDVFHVLFSVGEIPLEFVVELPERVRPLLFAVFDLVEFSFETRRVLRIEYVLKVLDEQIGNDQADFRGNEFSTTARRLLHVLALLDRAQDGGIGGRPSDAAFFELLHQRRLVETRRRFGEVLLRLETSEFEFLSLDQRRQLMFQRLVFLVLGVFRFLIDLQEAVELQHRSIDAELIAAVIVGGLAASAGLALSGMSASISTVVRSKTAGAICEARKRCQMSL